MKTVFTFWEGPMPAYIKMCMDTWKVPYVLLNYDNLDRYTDLKVDDQLKRFSLAQIADCVRVHVLRDQGGYWLDADTIMITDHLPDVMILGDPVKRTNTIGYLHTEPRSDMFTRWAAYQDKVIADPDASHHWSIMGNAFTDPYLAEHQEVKIGQVRDFWPETYMFGRSEKRYHNYCKLYFSCNYNLSDLMPTSMLMLHNSWTPDWYRKLDAKEVMMQRHTLSNVLNEVLMLRPGGSGEQRES